MITLLLSRRTVFLVASVLVLMLLAARVILVPSRIETPADDDHRVSSSPALAPLSSRRTANSAAKKPRPATSGSDEEHDHKHEGAQSSSPSSFISWKLHPNSSQVKVTSVTLLNWRADHCGAGVYHHDSSTKTAAAAVPMIVVTVSGDEMCRTNNDDLVLSNNKNLRETLLRRGPHLFRLRLDGPTVFTVPQADVVVVADGESHKCVYRFPLLSSPQLLCFKRGAYRVGLEMLYRNYAYLDESSDKWPELLKTPLLVLSSDALRTKYHLQQCTLPSREVLQCGGDDGNESEEEAEKKEGDSQSAAVECDGTQHDTSGVWQREKGPATRVWTRVRVRKIRREPILFEWASQSEPAARWVPNACRVPPLASSLSREKIFELYSGKRIVISGDSQLRALYYALVNVLNGNSERCVRNVTTFQDEPAGCIANVKGSQRKSISPPSSSSSSSASMRPIQVDYIDDLFLNRIKHKLQGYDVVIAGFGQHPASKEHWRFDKYAHAVQERMSHLKKVAPSPSSVIWYAAPHYPHTRAGYPVAVRDWRTDARLELFNNCSVAAARENGFLTLDSFAISDAFAHTSPDQAHFSNFVAVEFVRMLFSILIQQRSNKA